jgi:hypothetical protein
MMMKSHLDMIEENDVSIEYKIREEVLDEALALITGQRAIDYGSAHENFGCIAAMWSAYLGYPVTASDTCHMMALLKIVRLRNGKHRDSSCDGAGYLALGAEVSEDEG